MNDQQEYCNGCGSRVWYSTLSKYMLCPECEKKSVRLGEYPVAGWSEPLKKRRQ